MHTPEGSWGGSGLAWPDETVSDYVVREVVEIALDAVQDAVAHATRGTAWPSDPETTKPLPRCWAAVKDGVLAFGYGSRTIADDVRLTELAI